MKKYISISIVILSLLLHTSCNDWLTEPGPGTSQFKDAFKTKEDATKVVNGSYTPLAWEFDNFFYNEWFIGDIVSDDALKGGQNISDMPEVYAMENFKTNSSNAFLLKYYRAQFMGVSRCNLAIQEIPKMPASVIDARLQDRLVGEVKFLRAMYYLKLVRVFGGVPKVDFVVDSSSKWKQPRASADDIYSLIIEDLIDAEKKLWKKSEYDATDLGRATKGAAQAMLLKAYLQTHNYTEAEKWGQAIIDQAEMGNEYSLFANYQDNFKLINENGVESVFEIQYMEEGTSDYGDGNGFTRGTYAPILTRSRSSQLGGGWGFNKPTQNLYNEFESADPRRDVTILNPTAAQIENPELEIYLGSRYVANKYTMMTDGAGNSIFPLNHPSRGPINKKEIRYADVLLMYAEACAETGNTVQAKWALEEVRARARNGAAILPAFPAYNGYVDNKTDLVKAIRHERRVELAMEGHRWFDLCRWGVAKEVMDAYKTTETAEAKAQMADFVKGKHELFPLPAEEISLNSMPQNTGY